jgi:hypothetical protein
MLSWFQQVKQLTIVYVCKGYWDLPLLLGISLLTKDELLQNHLSVLNTFNIPKNQDQFELPYHYRIPKLHKNPYKRRYIAGSSKCSTKPPSLLLTKLLTTIKESLLRYCFTTYSRSGVNQIWILKNSKDKLSRCRYNDLVCNYNYCCATPTPRHMLNDLFHTLC